MKQKSLGCLLAILLVALVASVFMNMVQFGAGLQESMASVTTPKAKARLSEMVEAKGDEGAEGKIVQIDLEGMITSSAPEGLFGMAIASVSGIKHQLEQAVNDASVKAIVLRINSPGGEVTASDILYTAVKAAAAVKPVVVHMDAIAASGGYYIACAANKIVATETTLTASIGVIIDTMNYAALFDKVGLESNTFVSGAFKDSLSGSRPMRDEERAYVQGLVDQMYDRFLTVVSEGRNLPKPKLKWVADGRVVTGREALEVGLVDQIGYVEDAYAVARELGQAEGAPVVRYRQEVNFFDLLARASVRNGSAGSVKVELSQPFGPVLKAGLPYYLAPLTVPTR